MISDSYKDFFKAFSSPTRFEIVKLLGKGPHNVSDICSALKLEQSRVSHNLRCLVNCGFVDVKQNGKYRVYVLDRNIIQPLLALIEKHSKKYEKRLKKCEVLYGKRKTKK